MEEFFGCTITSLLLSVVGAYWIKYPPKKINYLYGYRTRRSMLNQEIWNFSNRIGAKMMLFLGITTLFLSIIIYFVFPAKSVFISIMLVLIGLGIGMHWCETQINRHFDQNGNLKRQN